MENPKTETTGSYKARVKKKTKKIAIIVYFYGFYDRWNLFLLDK